MKVSLRIIISCCCTLLIGCTTSEIERKLQAADSLMLLRADSSLKILQSIDLKQISSDEDQSYYSVLMTEANYKKKLPLTSDSLILLARDYYLDQGDRYMLGRALYCLGITHEQMKQPYIAIEDYKQAEPLIATRNDITRQAVINSKIGYLYNDKYFPLNAIERYKKAAILFRSIGDSLNLARQYGMLSWIYRGIESFDSSDRYYEKTMEIAKVINNRPLIIESTINHAWIERERGRTEEAKQIIDGFFDTYKCDTINYIFYLFASIAFDEANYNSALHYLSRVDSSFSLSQYEFRSQIKAKLNDINGAIADYEFFRVRVDEIWDQRERNRIDEIEARYDNHRHIAEKETMRKTLLLWGVISGLSVLLLISSIILFRLYYKRREKSYRDTIETLQSQRPDDTLLEMLGNRQQKLRQAIEERLSIIGELITLSYEYKNNSRVFASKFNELLTKNPLDGRVLGDIVEVVNNGYNGLIDYLRDTLDMGRTEQIVAALSCVGLTSHQLYIILGYDSVDRIYYYKSRINTKIGRKGDLRHNLLALSEELSKKR